VRDNSKQLKNVDEDMEMSYATGNNNLTTASTVQRVRDWRSAIKGFAYDTKRAYTRHINDFLRHIDYIFEPDKMITMDGVDKLMQSDINSYFDAFAGNVESGDQKRVRKAAVTWLVNNAWDQKMKFKKIRCKGHSNAKKNPHKAYTESELREILAYANTQGSHEMYCLLLTLFTLACRI
jgi:hypothetical protein